MNFYKGCIGGELTLITVEESPMADHMLAEMKDAILHSSLLIGEYMIMGSDMRRKQLTDGDTVTICVYCESEDDMNRFYENLSAREQLNNQ